MAPRPAPKETGTRLKGRLRVRGLHRLLSEIKLASVYRRRKAFHVQTNSIVEGVGAWAGDGPLVTLAAEATATELGHAVQGALSVSRDNMPRLRSDESIAPILEATGAKSWAAFTRGSLLVHVESSDPGGISVQPCQNLGRGGFSHEGDCAWLPLGSGDAMIGEAVLAALGRCS